MGHFWVATPQSIDCNPVLSTEPTGPYCESLTMLAYIELSYQAPSYDHNLFTRVYTLKLRLRNSHSFRKSTKEFNAVGNKGNRYRNFLQIVGQEII